MAFKGVMNRDLNGVPIQRARGVVTLDGNGNQSPVTVSSGAVRFIAPTYAVAAFIYTSADIWLDNKPGVGATQGFKLAADSNMYLEIEAGKSLYMVRVSGDAAVSIMWQVIPE